MTIPVEDVRLPSGVVVRIRALEPADQVGLDRLLAAHDAVWLGEPGALMDPLVADYAWGNRLVGHGGWRRTRGPRAAAVVTVARDFAHTLVAAHLLVRIARLADATLVPTLVVARPAPGSELDRLLSDGFGARPTAGGALELATDAWPEALARLGHVRSNRGRKRAVAPDGGCREPA
jgi:hypothetical protein